MSMKKNTVPYLHAGGACVLRGGSVIGIFDLDTSSASKGTRLFLEKMQKSHRVEVLGEETDLPRSAILTDASKKGDFVLYLSPVSSKTLATRKLQL